MEENVAPDSNAGNEWPPFELPSEIPKDEPAAVAAPVVPAAPATPAATPTPAVAGQPPAQPSTPSGTAADGETVPKYRLDEQKAAFEATTAAMQRQIDALIARVGAPPAATPATPAVPATPELSAQDLAVRERLYAVVPGLKRIDEIEALLAKKDDILGAASATTAWQKQQNEAFDTYAVQQIGSAQDKVAALMFGEGKAAADLPPMVKDQVMSGFTSFVLRDKDRSARYDRGDATLVGEFVAAYKAAHIDPLRRDANAAVLTRPTPAVPAGGGSAPVAAATPQSVTNLDEDEVHKRAWANRDSVGV